MIFCSISKHDIWSLVWVMLCHIEYCLTCMMSQCSGLLLYNQYYLHPCILGRSLMIGWRKTFWNLERVPAVVTVSVCAWTTGHIFWPRNLIFRLNDPWDIRKKCNVLFFEIFISTLLWTFFIFPYITLVNFCFQATCHSFSHKAVIFGFIRSLTIRK